MVDGWGVVQTRCPPSRFGGPGGLSRERPPAVVRGDRMRSYRKFLGHTGDNLLEVMRIMENESWHHMADDSEQVAAYVALVEVLQEIVDRAKHYVDSKITGEARVQAIRGAEAQDSLDRLLVFGLHSGQRPERAQYQLDDHDGGEAGIDGGPDAGEYNV